MSVRLKINNINSAVKNSLNYIEGRRNGTIQSLKTGLPKLDKALLDGVEWNKILTIGAMSGSGKSVLCEQLKRNFIFKNPKEKLKILSFEFEMPSYEQITRNISGRLNKSTQELYSAGDNGKLSDSDFEKVKEEAKKLSQLPIFSVDDIGSVEEIENTVLYFVEKNINKDEGIVVTIDHALLVKMSLSDDERRIVAHLYRTLVSLKKNLVNKGIKCLFIILSQLNRNIETIERKANPEYHFPNRNDLFGSNDIFINSDYVLIIHKPAILKLDTYGVGNLPIWNPNNRDQAMIYLHLIKHRSGTPQIMKFLDNFKNSKIDEIS